MTQSPSQRRFVVEASHPVDIQDEFAREVRAGLTAPEKSLPCRFFYDAEGARLFEEICTLDEYYPTRTEAALLDAVAPGGQDVGAERKGSWNVCRLRREARIDYLDLVVSQAGSQPFRVDHQGTAALATREQ